ncbi:MAG: transposase-like protein/IS1 family transposase [Planctomycetota bacterium]
MRKGSRRQVACPNQQCAFHGRHDGGNIALHGFSKVKWGRRRRYRCKECSKTFGATAGTPYKRLQRPMRAFDRVAALSVEGVSKAAIARLERLSWNTVARWLELAAASARQFNDERTCGYVLRELQLDELNTFLQSRKRQTWVFAGIEVWSRLWTNSLVGSRTFRNTRRFVRNVDQKAHSNTCQLITTDGFKFYAPSIRLVFGPGCVLAQVIKKIKCNRVARVGAKLVIGSEFMLADALHESEDSNKLNTSFIERLNLTIRRGSAYLNRRSPCHARKKRTLDDHLELLRCYYNFCRPHGSLRFGAVTRTPAMQAGLATKRLNLRAILTARTARMPLVLVQSRVPPYQGLMETAKCAA